MKTIKGNLLTLARQGKFDVIVHGCNCFHTFGAGIALQIKKKYPEAYIADCENTVIADWTKLGTYTEITTQFFVPELEKEHALTIINAYTQYKFCSEDSRHVDYEAIANVFALIKHNFPSKRIGYPMIGAGLAGGNWKIIEMIINDEMVGMDHTLVVYSG